MPADFRFPLKSNYSDYTRMTEEKCGQPGTLFNTFSPAATVDSSFFEMIFSEAVKVAEERGVLLYCGEYGVIDRVSPEETLEWYKLISTVFNKYGIGRAAWNFRPMDIGLNDNRLDSIRGDLLKYL